MSVAIANDGSEIISKEVNITDKNDMVISDIIDYLDINQSAKLIIEKNYKKIALQFPDELLKYSALVAQLLTEKTSQKFYILADTSYGSCCVDEVASQHSNCDFLIHYGSSCTTTPAASIPILYIFGKNPINVSQSAFTIASMIKEKNCADSTVILLCDVLYYWALGDIATELQSQFGFDVVQRKIITNFDKNDLVKQHPLFVLPEGKIIENSVFCYIGSEGYKLNDLIMTHSSSKIFSYDPTTNTARLETIQANRMLMKRYLMIQKAKDSDVIGIVIGTLGIKSYLSVITSLQNLITLSGKKPYLISVGKPTVAKLANFLEVDLFVLVACPESTIQFISDESSREYLKPIVTVFELEMVLNKDVNSNWIPGGSGDSGKYVTDFTQFSTRLNRQVSQQMSELSINNNEYLKGKVVDFDAEKEEQSSDEEPEFSIATGKLIQKKNRSTAKHIQISYEETNSTSLVHHLDSIKGGHLTQFLDVGSSYLNSKRSFKGLQEKIGETPVTKFEEGRRGIAKNYSGI